MTASAARSAVAARDLTAVAVGHLTEEIAVLLPFERLGPFKTLLKAFFSNRPWTPEDQAALSAIVTEVLETGWWEHRLDDELTLRHGIKDGRYEIDVVGEVAGLPSLFERVFAGPVVPEATPHPQKVKFNTSGPPGPGRWYRRSDEVDDPRVASLFESEDVTDVMVAGNFVTIGLRRDATWEQHLDPMIDAVTGLFFDPDAPAAADPERTRDELVGEGLRTKAPEDLHLLDPDDPSHRRTLQESLQHPDAEIRRVALATLAQSDDTDFATTQLVAAYRDRHRIVRRMAIDGAADLGHEALRPLFEQALGDPDPWTRWKAIRGLREIGAGPSAAAIEALADDDDFQVRFEAAAARNDLR